MTSKTKAWILFTALSVSPSTWAAPRAQPHRISALLLSDFHFDPFHDPGKAPRLAAAPVSQWESILSSPASSDQEQAFKNLERACGPRGVDTPYALLNSSLEAMRAQAPDAKFITVSGDLLGHSFSCRYKLLVPGKTPGDYRAFVQKTLHYLIGRLRSSFAGVPIYIALGNNDTVCGDYSGDRDSEFLRQTAKAVAEGLPESPETGRALDDFAAGGYYSVPLTPMTNTRLLVIDDVFFSQKHRTCAGKPDTAGPKLELAWLEKELASARRQKQKVWVMGHIPPGVDVYSTFSKMKNVCGGTAPAMFLASEKLPDLLAQYADTVQLGLFSHTHMDEFRLLQEPEPEASVPTTRGVAIKITPSISPVDGNNPAFTVGQIDPSSGTLMDYTVFAASNQTGLGTVWSKEYKFSETFKQPAFSAQPLIKLIDEFESDPLAITGASRAYLKNFFVGDRSFALRLIWSRYVCALSQYSAKGFTECVCHSGGK